MSRPKRALLAAGVVAAALGSGSAAFALWTRHGGGPRAPVIGVSVSPVWYDRTGLQPGWYEAALARSGANVRRIRRGDPSLEGLDGIVLIGGGDVDPRLFGGDPERASRVDRAQDDLEIDLLRRAEERGLPVLAVCRGMQLLAVAHGGTLRPLEGEAARRHGITPRSLEAHGAVVLPGTRLHGAIGTGPHRVSSTHLQAVDDPGPRLRVAARAEDGVIEAVELPGRRLVLGIQWHPEWESVAEPAQLAPFRLLVEAAKAISTP
jgi:gamma-glutamyl-gamma-aminobutyrate hydrolase PuuD